MHLGLNWLNAAPFFILRTLLTYPSYTNLRVRNANFKISPPYYVQISKLRFMNFLKITYFRFNTVTKELKVSFFYFLRLCKRQPSVWRKICASP